MTDINIEQELELYIKKLGLDAPRLTPDAIDGQIIAEDYHIFPNTCMTVCCLTLKNGFTVVGESACASPENFNEEIGRAVAKKDAREKIWKLEGYRLKQYLADMDSLNEMFSIVDGIPAKNEANDENN